MPAGYCACPLTPTSPQFCCGGNQVSQPLTLLQLSASGLRELQLVWVFLCPHSLVAGQSSRYQTKGRELPTLPGRALSPVRLA